MGIFRERDLAGPNIGRHVGAGQGDGFRACGGFRAKVRAAGAAVVQSAVECRGVEAAGILRHVQSGVDTGPRQFQRTATLPAIEEGDTGLVFSTLMSLVIEPS